MAYLTIWTGGEAFSSASSPAFVHEVCAARYSERDAAQVLWEAGDTFHGIATGSFRSLLIRAAFHADTLNLSALSRTGLGVVYAAIDYKQGGGTVALLEAIGKPPSEPPANPVTRGMRREA